MIKPLTHLAMTFALLALSMFSAPDAMGEAFILEKDTAIKVRLADTLSSQSAQVGQPIRFFVIQDVLDKTGKTVIIKEYTPVEGSVTQVMKSENYIPGMVSFQFHKTSDIKGNRIGLTGNIWQMPKMPTSSPIALLFGGMSARSGPMIYPSGTEFYCRVQEDVVLEDEPIAKETPQ